MRWGGGLVGEALWIYARLVVCCLGSRFNAKQSEVDRSRKKGRSTVQLARHIII